MLYVIDVENISSKNIIVLTFTKNAANEMRDRFLEQNKTIETPFFGTFHSLFYNILLWQNLKFKLIEEHESSKIIKDVLKSFIVVVNEEKIRELITCISVFKRSNLKIDEYNPTVDRNVFIRCYLKYEKYKKDNSIFDYDDLQNNAIKIIKDNEALLAKLRDKFKTILVDEFQDCDEVQLYFLKLFNSYSKIFAVGDEDQSIYSFRGASTKAMVEFENLFLNGKKIYLEINYRSSENLVQYSNKLITKNINRNTKEIHHYNTEQSIVKHILASDECDQAIKICSHISNAVRSNTNLYSDFAILYRTNEERLILIDYFIAKDIPFKSPNEEYKICSHFIYKDLIAYINLSDNFNDLKSLLRIINKPNRFIGKLTTYNLKNINYEVNCFEFLLKTKDIKINVFRQLKTLKKQLLKLRSLSFNKKLDFILNRLKYIDFLIEYSNENKIPLDILLKIYNVIKYELLKSGGLVEESNCTFNDINHDSVILSTIHGVKGKEFNEVFIVNVNEGHIPYKRLGVLINMEEERRVFYVAVTRSKKNLWVISTMKYRGQPSTPSSFINELFQM